ncbi:hypothetical protein GCM10027596_39410 [Nocardioides korecus]
MQPVDTGAIRALLDTQEGVVSRAQARRRGAGDHDVARLLRRREWSVVHPGVYVTHTGQPTRAEREWAAVLLLAPAALTGRSALGRHGVRTGRDADRDLDTAPVQVAVERRRKVSSRPGIEIVRLSRFGTDVLGNLSPPRVRLEVVLLDLAAAAADDRAAVAVLADGVGSRRTTAGRLRIALDERPRLRRRAFLASVLADVETGVHSVLEREYLRHVERAHHLPRAARQSPAGDAGHRVVRDVVHGDLGVVVELDGRLGHELARDRWDDLQRDVEAARDGMLTLRLGWGQVLDPCRTARAVASVLLARGWAGRAVACRAGCVAGPP